MACLQHTLHVLVLYSKLKHINVTRGPYLVNRDLTSEEAEFGFIMAAVKEEMYGCDIHHAEVLFLEHSLLLSAFINYCARILFFFSGKLYFRCGI